LKSDSAPIQSVVALCTALWWGSLTTIGFVVVPLLFARMPTKQMAGQFAALLFHYQAYVSWACIGVLLSIVFLQNRQAKKPVNFTENSLLFAGLAFSIVVYFVVAPQIAERQNLRLWHSLGTALYAGQWICATVSLWRLGKRAFQG
jgi:uncharacterized membrane protein